MSISVVLADDQPLARSGLRVIMADHPDLDVVGEAATGTDAVQLARELNPDVVVMDIRMPGMDGIEATRLITAANGTTRSDSAPLTCIAFSSWRCTRGQEVRSRDRLDQGLGGPRPTHPEAEPSLPPQPLPECPRTTAGIPLRPFLAAWVSSWLGPCTRVPDSPVQTGAQRPGPPQLLRRPTLTTHCHLVAIRLEPSWPPARTMLATRRQDPMVADKKSPPCSGIPRLRPQPTVKATPVRMSISAGSTVVEMTTLPTPSDSADHDFPGRNGPDATTEADAHRVGPVRTEYAPAHDGDPDPGEIVWTWVPFEENDGRGKDRPVLVVAREAQGTLLAVQLSSKRHDRDADWVAIGEGPWDREGRDSWIAIDRVMRLHEKGLRREACALDRGRFNLVVNRLRERYGWS
jgi:hypothetical protein